MSSHRHVSLFPQEGEIERDLQRQDQLELKQLFIAKCTAMSSKKWVHSLAESKDQDQDDSKQEGEHAKPETEQLKTMIDSATDNFAEHVELRRLRRDRQLKMAKRASMEVISPREHRFSSSSSLEMCTGTVLRKRKTRQEKRKMIIEEILLTERNYVKALNSLISDFLGPLEENCDDKDRDKDKEIISKSLVVALFSNIRAIRSCNELFLNDLEQRLAHWKDSDGISDIFITFVPYFGLYKDYINNHENALEVLRQLLGSGSGSHSFFSYSSSKEKNKSKRKKTDKSKKFISFLREKGKLSNVPLQSYLIMPIQRIPRYQLLLAETLKYTAEDHSDFQGIAIALEQVKAVADGINQAVKSVENSDAIAFLEKRFVDPIELLEFSRVLVKEDLLRSDISHLTTLQKAKKYYFALFSDMLLYTSRRKTKGKGKLVFRGISTFDEFCYVVDNPKLGSKTRNSAFGEDCCFQFIHKDGNIDIYMDNIHSKHEWMSALKEHIWKVQNGLLFEACWRGNADKVAALVLSGTDLNSRRAKTGNFPLFFAALHGHLNVVKELAKSPKCDLNMQNAKGQSALIGALLARQTKVVYFLLREGADTSLFDHGEFNALMNISGGDTIDPSEEVEDEFECLHPGLGISDMCLQLLISLSDVNAQTPEGFTAFMIACQAGDIRMAQLLLDAGFDFALRDVNGKDCLSHAINLDNVGFFEEMLAMGGGSLKALDNNGRNMLMQACQRGKTDMVEYLLKRGMDPRYEDLNGDSAFDLSVNAEICRLLAQSMKLGVSERNRIQLGDIAEFLDLPEDEERDNEDDCDIVDEGSSSNSTSNSKENKKDISQQESEGMCSIM